MSAEKMVDVPAGVTRPTDPPVVNQRFPSGPSAMPRNMFAKLPKMTGNSVTLGRPPADGTARPTMPFNASVNHRFPSGPTVMSLTSLSVVSLAENSAPVSPTVVILAPNAP